MEKRVLLAVVLCLATLYLWSKLFPPPTPPEPPPVAAPTIGASDGTKKAEAKPKEKASEKEGKTEAAPASEKVQPEQRTMVEGEGLYRAEVTSYGAALTSYKLLHKKYYTTENRRLVFSPGSNQPQVEITRTDEPTELVTSHRPALLTRFPKSAFTVPDIPAFSLFKDMSDGTGRTLTYVYETADVRIQKSLHFAKKSYQVGIEVEVKNLRTKESSHHFEIGLTGFQDPTQKPGGIFSARVPQNDVLWDLSGKMTQLTLESLLGEKVAAEKLRGDLRWLAIGQQYFILAVALEHGPKVGEKQGTVYAEPNGALYISAEYADRSLQPGQAMTYKATAFAGPKLPELLDEVKVDGQNAGLSTSIDYTLEVLARPLLWIMRQIYNVTSNWVVAIVLLTLLVKLLTLYPSHRSMVSMKKMAGLQPEITVLKEKCGDDKQRFNTELMELYKKRGVNPMGGCLPMLIQMPIWFALYSMLNNAVELYRVRFLWIPDLTAADPFFILPLLTGGLMYFQTKMSPTPADPQQKMMMVMMPIMFTAFSIFLPAGLTIYIMTNTVLGMLQQAVMTPNKKAPEKAACARAQEAVSRGPSSPEAPTIAAIATGAGGGIGIVRVSGARAEEIGRRVLRPVPAEMESHRMYLGSVVAEEVKEEVIDQVLFCLMRTPRSYTGEDVLEIHGHGGAVSLGRLLKTVLEAGARPAQPGEFTRRAFLSGKLDLTQAEAVAGLIEARSLLSAQQAQRQLQGALGQRISEMRKKVVALCGEVEGALDFPDAEADFALSAGLAEELSLLCESLGRLSQSFAKGGRALRQGIEIVLCGRTNAGKSSLCNALCQAERVLVDERPGTTRDYVEVRVSFEDMQVTLFDTPGQRTDPSELEQMGQRLSRERMRHADLLLYVVDGVSGWTEEDQALLDRLPALQRMIIWNKSDRADCRRPPEGLEGIELSVCSALCGSGLSTLKEHIRARLLPRVEAADEVILTSLRQANLLGAAAEGLHRAREVLLSERSWDLLACDLRAAAKLLGEVTGEEVSTDVLDEIFSRFCIGK